MRDGERVKVFALVSVLAACQYSPSTAPGVEPDAMPNTDDDAMTTLPDTQNPSIAPCNTPDANGLVLCLEMEDDVEDGTLVDSAPGHHDASAQNLAPAMRTVPGESPAAEIEANTVIRIGEDPAFDRDSAYTIAMWIRPNVLPAQGTVYGLIDHENQFAMLIGRATDGALQNRCVHTGRADFEYSEQLPENTWSFLACTWDGTEMCAWRWSADRDTERYCHAPTLAPQTSGAQGLAIGHLSENGAAHSRFDGAMDSVQIYDRGMTETQLCALIGKGPGCMPCIDGTCL